MTSRLITLPRPRVAADKLGYFRAGTIGGRRLLTGDDGSWHFLEPGDYADFLAGRIGGDDPRAVPLRAKGFLRDGLDLEALAERMKRRKRFVGMGPHLHILITTLRCNQSCRYCHASRTDMDRVDTDMSIATAKRVVDLAMTTTSPYVNFEFQGGEPTVNMDVIKFVVEYSREKNKVEGKELAHSLVTNFTYMTEENAAWLVANDVLVCTSLDGPQELHDWNRLWKKDGSAFGSVMRWIHHFNAAYVAKGLDPELWHVDALMTTTRKSFEFQREIVDLYVELGIRNLHVRPLNPYGFAVDQWKRVGYTMDEYLDFYAAMLDDILERNLNGVEIIEGTSAIFLAKMLTEDDPNFVDIRSPCGAGTGQVAYNYDGKLFTCDEGRMTSAMGSDMFGIGSVDAANLAEVLKHPTVRAMAVASLQDSLPGCSECWNKPYCGVCPMHEYMTSGDLFKRPDSPKCREHYTIASLLFEKLGDDPDGRIADIFRRWTINRPRETGSECAV